MSHDFDILMIIFVDKYERVEEEYIGNSILVWYTAHDQFAPPQHG
jgi:hypothetical protein